MIEIAWALCAAAADGLAAGAGDAAAAGDDAATGDAGGADTVVGFGAAAVGVGCAAGEHAVSKRRTVDAMPTNDCGSLFENNMNVYLSLQNRTVARVNGP